MKHAQMELRKTNYAEKRMAEIKKIDVDEIFAERSNEYGIAGAFGHLHAVYSDVVRKMEQVVADLRRAEIEVESLRIAAEKTLVFGRGEFEESDEPVYELLFSAATVTQQMIKADWSTADIVKYDIKDEEIQEERLIPKNEYCVNCGIYKKHKRINKTPYYPIPTLDQSHLCEYCQEDLVEI